MSLHSSAEFLGYLANHDNLMIGATLVGAASVLLGTQTKHENHVTKQLSDIPDIVPYDSNQGEAVVLIDVGLLQSAQRVSDRLGPLLAHIGPSYTIKHTSNIEASRENELSILKSPKILGRKVITLSTSKGGQDRLRVMSDPTHVKERGFTSLASFDSVPFTPDHIRKRGKAMLFAGKILTHFDIMSDGYVRYMGKQAHKMDNGFVRGTTADDFYRACQDMKILLGRTPPPEMIREAYSAENVGKIMTVSAPRDRLVDTSSAHDWFQEVTGREIVDATDSLRPVGDHAGVTSLPDFQIHELERHLIDDRDTTCVK